MTQKREGYEGKMRATKQKIESYGRSQAEEKQEKKKKKKKIDSESKQL